MNQSSTSAISSVDTILIALRSHVETQGENTAYTFLDADGQRMSRTFRELDKRAKSIAHALLQVAEPRDRALMMYPAGLDFIEAFLGCLYAGIVAVPAYPPRLGRQGKRILAIAENCQPRVLLCKRESERRIARSFSKATKGLSTIVVDDLAENEPSPLPLIGPDDVAFLQYTSGSTGAPKGVKVTHANLIANETSIQQAFEHSRLSKVVSWLPTFHDMGLVGATLQPLFVGFPSVHISPESFIRTPRLWLDLVSNERATTSGGPNFAYDYCVEKLNDSDLETLDLSTWRVAFNGSEPVRAKTLDRFSRKFERCGFRPHAFFPCYGLAEATLFVSGGPVHNPPHRQRIPRKFSPCVNEDVSSSAILTTNDAVSCGIIAIETEVAILDPSTATEAAPGEIGEICVRGPSVVAGYWQSETPHEAAIDDAFHFGRKRWLRTGDLGFMCDGQLFVTGRIKDLIIVRGRNIHAEDVEQAAQEALSLTVSNRVAAFQCGESDPPCVVILAEAVSTPSDQETSRAYSTLAEVIQGDFSIGLQKLVFIRRGSLPRTSSGKVRRRESMRRFDCGALKVLSVVSASAFSDATDLSATGGAL